MNNLILKNKSLIKFIYNLINLIKIYDINFMIDNNIHKLNKYKLYIYAN